MDRLFGEYLVKCKVNEKPPAAEEESKEVADPDAAEQPSAREDEPFYPYEKISVDDALIRTSISHLLILFTAEYCPPCQGFM